MTYTLEGEVKLVDGQRGVEGRILGEVEYNSKTGTFDKFELVMAGERWGRTRYNAREDDTERAPIGYAMKIAEDKATEESRAVTPGRLRLAITLQRRAERASPGAVAPVQFAQWRCGSWDRISANARPADFTAGRSRAKLHGTRLSPSFP
jgi:hypothetical protein